MKKGRNLLRSVLNGVGLLKVGNFHVFKKEFRKRVSSETLSLGLKRNLKTPFQNPDAKIPISVRKLQPVDIESLFKDREFIDSNYRLVNNQLSLVDANLPTCYVAIDKNGSAGYMQWLIGPQYNSKIQSIFNGIFPVLNDDEALLEAAFMSPAFRGLGIMPAAMSRIAEKAKKLNVSRVITFVGIDNIPSLKGCHRAGFSPYVLRKDKWTLFRQNVTFHPISEYILTSYHREITGTELKSIHSDHKSVKPVIHE